MILEDKKSILLDDSFELLPVIYWKTSINTIEELFWMYLGKQY